MAKLGSYFALCPLIDAKSIFGILEDPEKGMLLATLGKNMASKYKISDQRQVCCWRTKEKFSSPVVYDSKQSKYLAVFNQSIIKLWNAEENLDKVKKYQFNKAIYTLISDNENTFVVFQNGAIYLLDEALELRKTLIPEGCGVEKIEDFFYKKVNDHLYIGLIVQTDEYNFYWTKTGGETYKFSKMKLFRQDLTLNGYVFHVLGNAMTLVTLWSDSSIYAYTLDHSETDKNTAGELFAVIESVSSKHAVSMLSLDENYIAMYGADLNEEGAMLILYNTQFKVTQSRQPLKLFTDGAKLWCVDNYLVLPVGQNLAVIPFHLETEQLAALVGSHKSQNERDACVKIVNELDVASWDKKYKFRQRKEIPFDIQSKIEELVKQGLPESLIFEELLPDIMDTQDVNSLALCLHYFSDIPEKYLVTILKFVLTANSKYFDNYKSSMGNGESGIENLPVGLQPFGRCDLISGILRKPFSEVLLLRYLCSELTLNDVSLLLSYIYRLWADEGRKLPFLSAVQTEAKLLAWSCVLIDSSYQKIVLSNDGSVKDVLERLNDLICEYLQSFSDLNALEPLLAQFKAGKFVKRNADIGNLRYSVEQLSLY